MGEHYGPGCKDDVYWVVSEDVCGYMFGGVGDEGAAGNEGNEGDVDVVGDEGAEGNDGDEGDKEIQAARDVGDEGNEGDADDKEEEAARLKMLKIVRDEFHEIRTRHIASGKENGEFDRLQEESAHAYKYSAIG